MEQQKMRGSHPLPRLAVDILTSNKEYKDSILIHRSVYHVFNIICPKCGSTTKVSNGVESDGTFTMDVYGQVGFNCKHCPAQLDIPVRIVP